MRSHAKLIGVGLSILMLTVALAGCNRGPSDETLVQNVKAKLSADPRLGSQAVNVTATGGVVTLAGTVSTDADKSSAEQLAKGVEGVKSVTNTLMVKPPVVNAAPPPVSEDTKLRGDVSAALTKYGITGVTATVANGEVTLTGDIPRAKLQDAMKAANEAHPKKVINKMNIK